MPVKQPIRTAAKEAATNWGAVSVFLIFAVTTFGMAHNLEDGSELKTTLIVGFLSFATLFAGYWFAGAKDS